MIKPTLLVASLLIAVGLPQLSFGLNAEAVSSMKALSEESIKAIQANDFEGAAELFQYPRRYTSKELRKDKRTVALSLKSLVDSFGSIQSFAADSSISKFYECSVGGGTIPYWKEHPISFHFIYKADFTKVGKGFITVQLATIDNKTAIRSISFGLPTARSDSQALVTKAMEEMLKIGGPKTHLTSPKQKPTDRI